MRKIPVGRVARGGRAARLVRRAVWREACPPRYHMHDYEIVGGVVRKAESRISYHVWSVMVGLRWPLFRKNSREQADHGATR